MINLLRVAASKDDIVRLQGGDHTIDDVLDPSLPFPFTQPLQACCSDVMLERLAVPVRQMCEFHWLQVAIDNHRGAKSRTEPEEQHSAPLVTSERLHQSVVDNLGWSLERLFEIES